MRIPSPVAQPSDAGSEFNAIDGVAADDLWAVGHENQSFLAAHWNGSSWNETPVPPGMLENQILEAVSVVSSDNVWIGGSTGDGSPEIYLAQWDGSSWQRRLDDFSPSTHVSFTDLKVFADDDLWIGAARLANGAFSHFVFLHWDGSSWTEHAAPTYHSPSFAGDDPSDFYSVGHNSVMHWNGSTWEQVGGLEGQRFANFEDGTVLPDGTVWAAGRTTAGSEGRTLAARFDPCDDAMPGDATGDLRVDVDDLVAVVTAWGTCAGGCSADLDANGAVDVNDLVMVILNWS